MAQTLTVPSGLVSREGARVPLVGVVARAEIRDYACRVCLSQRFRNDEDRPIEAVYKFPLDDGAAVSAFEVEVDGRTIRGRVEEREKAFEAYDEAMAAGHGAYLLDEERSDVFTVSVGNLPPGKEAVLRLTTVSELPLEGDAIRFTLPTTIAPRYAPAEDLKGVGESEADRVSPPYALEVPYGLTLEVDVRTSAPVRSVESPSHPIAVTIDGGRATVRLSEREAVLDRDVVLKIALAETHAPRAVLERAPDGQAFALLSFRPRLEAKPAPAEVLFLVDRSGSMQGTSIAEARNALQLALRSLRPGCQFNLVGFGSSYESLFPESRPYDEKSLAEATKQVERLQADLGGTELLPALEHVLATPPRPGLPRQLFVLTDGEVSNTDAVIALARRHAGDTRVFTFGIGAGASHHLVKGLARAGEGEAEMIAPGERVEAKVMRQLSRALAQAFTEVSVDWGGLAVTQAPYEVPPV
ncbi:MAG TPA: VIT and VWA domain-containing protein, partial [Vicinamibacteria bacterium]